jgi:hypothetical protein
LSIPFGLPVTNGCGDEHKVEPQNMPEVKIDISDVRHINNTNLILI